MARLTKGPHRVLITGGRVAVDDRIAKKALTLVFATFGEDIVFGDGDAIGYDRLVRGLAKEAGCATETFRIDRKLDGDGDDAPKKRNLRMERDFAPTLCLSMPGGPGTRHMWTHCFQKGLPVISVEVDGDHLHVCVMQRHHQSTILFNGPIA